METVFVSLTSPLKHGYGWDRDALNVIFSVTMDRPAQMLSVSFDTEISSLFWGLLGRSQSVTELPGLADAQSSVQYFPVHTNPSSQFLYFLVLPTTSDTASAYHYLRYSFKTAGLLAMAGMFSYCAYSGLSTIRTKMIESNFLKSSSETEISGIELVVHKDSVTSTPTISRHSRPESLPLSCELFGGTYLRTLAKAVFSQNRTLIRVLAGEEDRSDNQDYDYDYDELESTYFGPLGEDLSEDENGRGDELEDNYLMPHLEAEVAPVSPADSAYTSEYESIVRPRP